jgi:hypothetical protein
MMRLFPVVAAAAKEGLMVGSDDATSLSDDGREENELSDAETIEGLILRGVPVDFFLVVEMEVRRDRSSSMCEMELKRKLLDTISSTKSGPPSVEDCLL